jgi:hypothetical protein
MIDMPKVKDCRIIECNVDNFDLQGCFFHRKPIDFNQLQDPNHFGLLTRLTCLDIQNSRDGNIGMIANLNLLKSNPNLKKLTFENIFSNWHFGDISDAILAMKDLRTLIVRFEDNDAYPRDLDELVHACPHIEVYGHWFNDLEELVVYRGTIEGTKFKKLITDFAKKASKWTDLRELGISLPPVNLRRPEFFEVAKEIFKIFSEVCRTCKLKVIRVAPHRGDYNYLKSGPPKEHVFHRPGS